MFDEIDMSKKMGKEEHKAVLPPLKLRIGELQRAAHEAEIPLLVVFEGWEPMSMAFVINRFLQPLDPRGFSYHNITTPEVFEQRMPFMWRFWVLTPWKGNIAVFDRSWYSRAVAECLDDSKCKALPQSVVHDIIQFERLLADDGAVIIKMFLNTSWNGDRKVHKKIHTPKACGLVVEDLDSDRLYRKHLPLLETIIERTDSPLAPWLIVEADDPDFAEVKVMRHVISMMETALAGRPAPEMALPAIESKSLLANLDMSATLPDSEYKDKLSRCQSKLREMQCRLFDSKRRLVIVFEGRDAAGKGGNINRLTQTLNPRTYQVVPTGAPDDMELAHHFLWRFQRRLPLPGHISIFDRSWYGRVLVERVESLATPTEWRRAYQEINDYERWLADDGTIVVKLWLEVDKNVQLQRFNDRTNDPKKTWKITAEDWAAREKWDAYTEAIDEMLERTSTPFATWRVVPSNDKNHARIETLRAILYAVEKELD